MIIQTYTQILGIVLILVGIVGLLLGDGLLLGGVSPQTLEAGWDIVATTIA